jgi:hypothetical protein
MSGTAALRWWVFGLLALSASCRAHDAVCEGVACDVAASSQSGAGGESFVEPTPMAGAAGETRPGCVSHDACDNGRACDGEERCVDASCQPGDPISCDGGTSCQEGEGASCVFERDSPWLLVVAEGDLWVQRVQELTEGAELVRLIAGQEDPLELVVDAAWVPDGSMAVAQTYLPQFTAGFKTVRFGAGLPSAEGRLRDVPLWVGVESLPDFSPDSRLALVYDYDTGSYLVSLKDDRATERIPPLRDDYVSGYFCEASNTWLQSRGYYEVSVARLTSEGIVERELGHGESFGRSPDLRMVAILRDDEREPQGVTLTSCSTETDWASDFPGASDWVFSSNSQLLWLYYDSARQVVYDVQFPGQPLLYFENTNTDIELLPTFTPNGRQVLARSGGELVTFDIPGSTTDSSVALGLDEHAEVVELTNDDVIAWQSEEEGRSLRWQSLTPSGSPHTIVNDAFGSASYFHFSSRPQQVFVSVPTGEGTELIVFERDEPTGEPKVLLKVAGDIDDLKLAPDDSGLVFRLESGPGTGPIFWASFTEPGELAVPRQLTPSGSVALFQPWPRSID